MVFISQGKFRKCDFLKKFLRFSDSLTYLTNHLSDCNAKQRQAVIRKIISVIEAMGCQSDSIDLNKLKDILKEAGDNSRRFVIIADSRCSFFDKTKRLLFN